VSASDIATREELLVIVPAGSVGPRATATISVATYPVPAGTTVTAGSLVLTAANVARTSGANNFRGNAGSAAAVAADIAAAINDTANTFAAASWSASVDGSGSVVDVVGATGPDGDVTLVSSHASIVVAGFSGGAAWVDHALGFAEMFLDASCWGNWLNTGSIYLAGHVLTQIPGGLAAGLGGNTTSVSIGAISKSFSVAAPTDPQFGLSSWGKLYLTLAESVYCAPGGVAGAGGIPLGIAGGC
jgi:hypothetical protein